MIEKIDRSPAPAIYRRYGEPSFWFELEEARSGKRRVLQIRRTAGITVSKNELVEISPRFYWADPGQTIRLTDAILKGILSLPFGASDQDKFAVISNQNNWFPKSPYWNNELESILLTALERRVVISRVDQPTTNGIYSDLRAADMLDQFNIRGIARFLAGIGVVENVITLADNRQVNLTSLVLPEDQPVISQLKILTLEPLWNLVESVGFYGIIPYLWTYGLFDFKTFCDAVQKYWPSKSEREYFVFEELMNVIKTKQSTALTEVQVDLLMKNFS